MKYFIKILVILCLMLQASFPYATNNSSKVALSPAAATLGAACIGAVTLLAIEACHRMENEKNRAIEERKIEEQRKFREFEKRKFDKQYELEKEKFEYQRQMDQRQQQVHTPKIDYDSVKIWESDEDGIAYSYTDNNNNINYIGSDEEEMDNSAPVYTPSNVIIADASPETRRQLQRAYELNGENHSLEITIAQTENSSTILKVGTAAGGNIGTGVTYAVGNTALLVVGGLVVAVVVVGGLIYWFYSGDDDNNSKVQYSSTPKNTNKPDCSGRNALRCDCGGFCRGPSGRPI